MHYTLRWLDVKNMKICYTETMIPDLQPRFSNGGTVEINAAGQWKLQLQVDSREKYHWAQIDDYLTLPRRAFHWRAPIRLRLQARVSDPSAAGTWGFGLWNDPFALNLVDGAARRMPVLPNAAWFFYSLPPNFLTLRDEAPGHGFLAQVFSSPRIPAILLAPAGLAAPLLAWRTAARLLRKLARRVVNEESVRIHLDVTQWHGYELLWLPNQVRFLVDDKECGLKRLAPRGPLGLVLWIDNQYLAFPPDGRLRFGILPVKRDAILELRDISIENG